MSARSTIFVLGVAAALSACSEAAVEMSLELPPSDVASRFSPSCVTAVQVFVRGNDRGDDDEVPPDDVKECITIEGADSWARVRSAIAGRFQLGIPASGLAGVDVRGSTGTCKKDNSNGDTIFYASASYDGGDELALQMTPVLSCNQLRPEVVRPVDLLALTRGGCPTTPLADNSGGVDSITIHPSAIDGATWEFNDGFALLGSGVARLPVYLGAHEGSCAAFSYWEYAEKMSTETCARRGPGVCTQGNEIELPIIDYYLAYEAADTPTIDEYGGFLFGGVWGIDGTGAKVKLAGATVKPAKAADAARAKVVYADYPATARLPNVLAGATATNASGLFLVYVGAPIDFIVSAPGYVDETVRLGSANEPATALIVLKRPGA